MKSEVITLQKCQNVGCTTELGYFDIKNGKKFCRKCRSNNILRWKCRLCPNILQNSDCRETRKYCDNCKGMPNAI